MAVLKILINGSWVDIPSIKGVSAYDIYKDPITDDGTKKSLRGLLNVSIENGEYVVKQQCTSDEEATGELKIVYENGKLFNQTSLTEVRKKIESLI